MDKAHIIAEIQRTTAANGGQPLGAQRFHKQTGITKHDWYGRYWVRWSEAVTDAGFTANELSKAVSREFVIETLVTMIRELGHFPVDAEIRMRSRNDLTLPGHSVFNRIGRKAELAAKAIDYCSARDGFDDVLDICRPIVAQTENVPEDVDDTDNTEPGYVYLIKSGKHYKVGHSNSAGRREYELAIQLPERATTVHTIATDDPTGIEAYWHKRFAAKRLNGEWFSLDPSDVRAFKRWKFT